MNTVIPRDLFNDGNLLKCYGQLYLNLERIGMESALVHDDAKDGFHVLRSEEDGSTSLANVSLFIRGNNVRLWRPMNSREPFPLYAMDDLQVFNNDGTFTPEMLAFLRA